MEQENLNCFNVPCLCTRGLVCFPTNEVSIEAGREKSINAIIDARSKFQDLIFIVSQKDPNVNDPSLEDLYQVGSLCLIKIIKKNSDESLKTIILASKRAKIKKYYDNSDYPLVEIEILESYSTNEVKEKNVFQTLMRNLNNLKNAWNSGINPSLLQRLSKGVEIEQAVDMISQSLVLPLEKKQKLLEDLDRFHRYKLLNLYIKGEATSLEIEEKLNVKVRESMEKNQKEYILREKLKYIKEELGDSPSKGDEIDRIRQMVNENPYPESLKERILDEVNRYEQMPPASQEAIVIRNYIDWLISIPWFERTEDDIDLDVVENTLNADHFGLDKIKERILEYLAVQALTKSNKAPILCFVGPPGVGKTSLAQSIAKALGRKFVKIALGGVHDEAEIRGHRRTYLGSMPGKIIQGMKKAKVINPLFLLDEVDKLASDYKGDPSSALLEVLDPEQNKFFQDNYIEENYDLSNVLFIATANYLENVPAPLRDRLEIINLSSYTEHEKLEIAKRHLVARGVKNNGLENKNIKFSDEALMHIIRYYTREAGVRSLERNISSICRKVAVNKLREKEEFKTERINPKKVTTYLGKEKFNYTNKVNNNQVGIVTGLAWTQSGGEILPIEVTHFPGKGNLVITGSLGDVMKESATIALSYVRANSKKFNIDDDIFDKINIHIHCPDGATPKDGPSAGVTMTTAIISSLTNHEVYANVGMTGEITLRGLVFPIGGLREKSIAAHRQGLKKICIPVENVKDLDEVPDIVKEELEIIPCTTLDDVLNVALVNNAFN